jgi:hypothetical protein
VALKLTRFCFKQLLADVRAVADSAPFDVFVFNSYFPFFDQFLSIVPDTIWSSALCMVAMAVISYLLLFNIKVRYEKK